MIFAYIPTLNNEKTIKSSIESILNQSKKPDFFCIIDSGSTDKTKDIVKSLGVEFLDPSHFGLEFLGLGRARNFATKLAKDKNCDFIFAIDSDVVPESNWLEVAHNFLLTNANYAGVSGQLIEANRVMLGDKFRAQIICCDLTKQELKDKVATDVKWLSGSQNLYKTADLLECGNFDESLKSNYEDIDIAIKLEKYDKKLHYLPQIIAYHHQKDSLNSAIDRFYRYEATKHERAGAFENLEKYSAKFEHLKAIFRHMHNISFNYARPYFAYPIFLTVYTFFLNDAKRFFELGKTKESNILFKTIIHSLNSIKSELIQARLNEDLSLQIEFLNANLKTDLEQHKDIFDWLQSFNNFEIFDKKYPAVSQHNIEDLDFNTKIKSVESSILRVKFEEQNLKHIYDDFKILLLNPTWRDEDRYGVRAGSRWPHTNKLRQDAKIPSYIPFPFFLAQCLAVLRQDGIAGHIIDAIAEGYNSDECLYEAFGYNPNLIVIETSTPSFYIDLDWAKKLKQKLPNVKICFVGPHVAFEGQKILELNSCLDFAVYGEYEIAVLELSRAVKNSSSLQNIKGLIYRQNGEVAQNGRTDVVDFFALPSPDRYATPFYNYNDRPIKELPYPSMQILLSRGCPYKCTFCLWPQVMFNKNYQLRDLNKAIEELKIGIENFGIKSFYVDDDTFNINKNHLNSFAKMLKENSINLPWMAMARADTVVDRETLIALKESGLIAIKFGIESVDETVLDEMKKDLDISKCEQTIGFCKSINLGVHLTFSIGYLSDTPERILKSFKWLIEQNPDSMQLSLVTPFPATKMYEVAKNAGHDMEKDYTKYDGARYTVVSSSISKDDLIDIRQAWINLFIAFKRDNEFADDDIRVLINGSKNSTNHSGVAEFKKWLVESKNK